MAFSFFGAFGFDGLARRAEGVLRRCIRPFPAPAQRRHGDGVPVARKRRRGAVGAFIFNSLGVAV